MKTRFLAPALILFGLIALSAQAAGLPPQASEQANSHAQNHIPVCPGPNTAGDVRCHAHVATDKGGTPAAGVLPGGLGPIGIHSAYTSQTTTATPKVIAIVDAYNDPNIYNDLTTYSNTYGIPVLPQCSGPVAAATNAPCFQKINQRGSTASFPQTNAGWSLEIALDVEVAHATCQNCSILLVEADSNSYSNLMTAVDRAYTSGANVISNSYGSNEFSGETSYDSHFNHPGVAITVSSGDNGYGAEYPAASPYVTAVGGTSLFFNSNGSYQGESAWNGAGSGCSAYEGKPAWQTDSGCSRRSVADVSAVADPNTGAAVYDTVRYYGRSGWFKVGGTSLAAPLIAGIYALSGKHGRCGKLNSVCKYSGTPRHNYRQQWLMWWFLLVHCHCGL
jgi:subtilase family serine protease